MLLYRTATTTNNKNINGDITTKHTQSLRQESNLRPRDCWAGALSTQSSKRSPVFA
ncbi:hypothetical protein EVAR_72703_1, partial [Eumeta japonica]